MDTTLQLNEFNSKIHENVVNINSNLKELIEECEANYENRSFFSQLNKIFINEKISLDNIKRLEKYILKSNKIAKAEETNQMLELEKINSKLVLKRTKDLEKIKNSLNKELNLEKPNEFNSEMLTLLGKKKLGDKLDVIPGKQKVLYNNAGCYICKKSLTISDVHFFYGSLCHNCGDMNYKYRGVTADLTGRIAIVTGGRVKIGFETCIKLLSYNCFVIATTRFPKDALKRFQEHPDYEKFKDNLRIYPLDLRTFKAIDNFINYLYENYSHIDILINNAAQTNRRPTAYYKELIDTELKYLPDEERVIIKDYNNSHHYLDTPDNNALAADSSNPIYIKSNEIVISDELKMLPHSVLASQIKLMPEVEDLNTNIKNYDNQPIDFLSKTTWQMEIEDINFTEFAEVQLINSWAPFYLCQKLKGLLLKSPFKDKYIVNVTAAEGIFNQNKTTCHPHTNMAKAGLNMLTRTVGKHYARDGIYMTAVDTGWVSYMYDYSLLFTHQKEFEKIYTNIPLDDIDGAMRNLHPVLEGIVNNNYLHACLLRHYKKAEW
jgi:NAD(P)-dependent dehydrogenase (short-subunit alcohol dehydrogenase family)